MTWEHRNHKIEVDRYGLFVIERVGKFDSLARAKAAIDMKAAIYKHLKVHSPLRGGPGYTLEDSDLWGLECAIEHALQDGYLADNREWALAFLEKLRSLRATRKER